MDDPEKLATQGKQDKEKQSKNTTQYMWDTTIDKQTQTLQQKMRTITCKQHFTNYP